MIKANIFREEIIELALKQLGKKYVHGNHGPDTFDCAGFVWYIYNSLYNIDLYECGYGRSTTTKILTSKYGIITDNLNKGDILFFHRQSLKDNMPTENNKYPGHCGIYLYDNFFVHTTGNNEVMISNFFDIIPNKEKSWNDILVAEKDIIADENVLKKRR